jgi:hypothetical protein
VATILRLTIRNHPPAFQERRCFAHLGAPIKGKSKEEINRKRSAEAGVSEGMIQPKGKNLMGMEHF